MQRRGLSVTILQQKTTDQAEEWQRKHNERRQNERKREGMKQLPEKAGQNSRERRR